jgi:hypothetical protein
MKNDMRITILLAIIGRDLRHSLTVKVSTINIIYKIFIFSVKTPSQIASFFDFENGALIS